jgi:N-acetylneuraminic acid mutarotase
MKRVVVLGMVGILLVTSLAACGVVSPSTTTASSTTTMSTTTTTTEPPAAWSNLQVSGEAPSPRCYPSLAYDSVSGRLLMFAGSGSAGSLSETWAFDSSANRWTNLAPVSETQPSAGAQIPAVYDPVTGKVIAFDGTTWGYDPVANTWGALNPKGKLTPARLGASMAYNSNTGKVFLFGGTDMAVWYSELWLYDPVVNTWTRLGPPEEEEPKKGATTTTLAPNTVMPMGRSDAGMVFDPRSGKVILFGGMDADYACLNDTWSYDPVTNKWTRLTPEGESPAARSAHAMAYDQHSGKVILFGGIDSQFTSYNDTWAYDVKTNAWTNLAPAGDSPPARGRTLMVYASGIDRLILFGGAVIQQDQAGGFGGTVYFNDTWTFGVTLQSAGSSATGTPVTTTTSLTPTTLGAGDTSTTLP